MTIAVYLLLLTQSFLVSDQALNNYVAQISEGRIPSSAKVVFYVKDGARFEQLQAILPSDGSLGHLFYAFGLISKDDLNSGSGLATAADVNFLEWLHETVEKAVCISEQHASSLGRIREIRSAVEAKFQLATLLVSTTIHSIPPPPSPAACLCISPLRLASLPLSFKIIRLLCCAVLFGILRL